MCEYGVGCRAVHSSFYVASCFFFWRSSNSGPFFCAFGTKTFVLSRRLFWCTELANRAIFGRIIDILRFRVIVISACIAADYFDVDGCFFAFVVSVNASFFRYHDRGVQSVFRRVMAFFARRNCVIRLFFARWKPGSFLTRSPPKLPSGGCFCSGKDVSEYSSCSQVLSGGPRATQGRRTAHFVLFIHICSTYFVLFVRLRNTMRYCTILVFPVNYIVRPLGRPSAAVFNCTGRWPGNHESPGHSCTRDMS